MDFLANIADDCIGLQASLIVRLGMKQSPVESLLSQVALRSSHCFVPLTSITIRLGSNQKLALLAGINYVKLTQADSLILSQQPKAEVVTMITFMI